MGKTTSLFGAGLIVLGVAAYLGTGSQSVTALIPAFFGIPLLIIGVLAAKEIKRVLLMHIAVVIGVLGVLGTMSGLYKVGRMIVGQPVERPEAVIVQSIMCVMMLAFVAMCVQSFVKARNERKASS